MTIQEGLQQDWNARLDKKIDTQINNLLDKNRTVYSVEQLDDKVNEEETLREYLEDSFSELQKLMKKLDRLTAEELNSLVAVCDLYWALQEVLCLG